MRMRPLLGLFTLLFGLASSVEAIDFYVGGYNNDTTAVFGKVDSNTGVFTNITIAGSNNYLTGLTWAPAINAFYVSDTNGSLNTITTTGTLGAQISGSLGNQAHISYNTSSSSLYNIAIFNFGTVDTTTGIVSSIANIFPRVTDSIAFHNGTLYAASQDATTSDYSFGSINVSTGAYTQLSVINSVYYNFRLASDGTNLYGLDYTSNTIYQVDPTNGALSSPIIITGSLPGQGFTTMGIATVPEPTTYALGLIALGILLFTCRRN